MPRSNAHIKKKYHKKVAGSQYDPCVFCGAEAQSIDHIQPRSKGGTNDIHNLAPMCRRCNSLKSDTSILLALMHPKVQRRIKITLTTERNAALKAARIKKSNDEWFKKNNAPVA